MEINSQLYWISALVAAGLDLLLGAVLVWRLPRASFNRLARPLALVAAVFWAGLFSWAANSFWTDCYQYVLPAWARPAATYYGLATSLVALLFWWLAQRLPGRPALPFLVLGGLHSLPGHLHGFSRGLMTNCPILVKVSPASALVFGIFEFMFYWAVVLSLAALLQAGLDFLRQRPHPITA